MASMEKYFIPYNRSSVIISCGRFNSIRLSLVPKNKSTLVRLLTKTKSFYQYLKYEDHWERASHSIHQKYINNFQLYHMNEQLYSLKEESYKIISY